MANVITLRKKVTEAEAKATSRKEQLTGLKESENRGGFNRRSAPDVS
ncbi:hypothetical protein IVB41_31130 [Bradyrhizobium sp. 44]|jgi:hypothetical protein|nr:hypothetical protein [Bradyrhizobium sp. 44]MCK1288367.1 hypothetical protein [Bradyrhizobium sp. 44]